MPMPAGHMPLGFAGLHPDGRPDAEFFILRGDIEYIQRNGPPWRYEDGRLIKDALTAPDCTFEGLNREEYGAAEGGYCYCVKPDRCYDDNGQPQAPPRGMVFLVFVRTGFGYVVFHWQWRREDPTDPKHPLGWREDFGRRLWQKP